MIKEGELSKFLLFWILSTLLLLLIIEAILRLAGYPRGIFLANYPTNSKLEMTWGHVPYTIETNSLGLRSHEITSERKPGVFRIVALGDSITEGYFVDNQDTYPQLLEDKLNEQGIPTEVINTGLGGGSIDKEFAMFRKTAYLAPDVAILTFVTNDIAEIRYKPKDYLVNTSLSDFRRQTAIRSWFITHTATGEAIYDWYLTWKYQSYKAAERQTSSEQRKNRYQIEGGDDYIANAQEFNQRYIDTDGLVLTSPFSKETTQLIDNYSFTLEHLNNFAQNNRLYRK